MTILRPRTTVSLVMRLASLMAATGTLYFELMPESVSPATTVWMMAAPLDGAAGLTEDAGLAVAAGLSGVLMSGSGAMGLMGATLGAAAVVPLSSYAAGVSYTGLAGWVAGALTAPESAVADAGVVS